MSADRWDTRIGSTNLCLLDEVVLKIFCRWTFEIRSFENPDFQDFQLFGTKIRFFGLGF